MTDQHNPLPHPHCYDAIQDLGFYTAEQMLEYGQAARKAARKAALKDAKQAVLDWLRPESEDMRSINDVLKELK